MNNTLVLHKHPTTFDEQRMAFFSEKSEKLNLTFNISVQFKMEGDIDPDIFRYALHAVVKRHSSMRVSFYKNSNQILKTINTIHPDELPLHIHDFSSSPSAFDEVRSVYIDSLNNAFDIYEGPGWRYHLCKTGPNVHVGILTAHHIIGDFKSGINIGQELQYHYGDISCEGTLLYQLNESNDIDAVEESAAQENRFYERYKMAVIEEIGGVQDLTFIADKPLFHERTFELNSLLFDIPNNLLEKIDLCANQNNISEMSILLSAFQIALRNRTEQNEFIIGLPVDIRPGKKHKGAIGYLSKPMFLHVDIEETTSYQGLINSNISKIRKTVRKRHFPLARLYKDAAKKKILLPKINVLFNYLNCSQISDPLNQLQISIMPEGFTHSSMDLWLTAQRDNNGVTVKLEFSKDVNTKTQLEDFKKSYLSILNDLCDRYEHNILALPTDSEAVPVTVVGSFTLDPIEKQLVQLLKHAPSVMKPHLMPYQHVFQTLLSTEINGAEQSKCISILIRVEDFFKHAGTNVPLKKEVLDLCSSFLQALKSSIATKKIPHQIVVCPSQSGSIIDECTEWLVSELRSVQDASVQDLSVPTDATFFNTQTNEIAHIPYHNDYYKTLAFYVAKHHYATTTSTPKVIILDCDNTLWNGVIGEDGIEGIEVTAAHQAFQKKLIACYDQGILLALSSKNNEEDVFQVFDNHQDMLLNREHIVAHRINWEPKYQSIESIRSELNLGIDSFIFIDDNPVEIDQCSSQIPSMLSVQFPNNETDISFFSQHHWAINWPDRNASFNRTLAYKEESERKIVKHTMMSVEDYITALDVQVAYANIDESNIERASQLTLRTNQFNLTGERITVCSLKTQIANGDRNGVIIKAQDKYGDYGIVGLLLYRMEGTILNIENTLLSCRVLGRGLEYHICQWITSYCQQYSCKTIRFSYCNTGKNKPGLRFLAALSDQENVNMTELSLSLKELEKVSLGNFICESPKESLQVQDPEDAQSTTEGRTPESHYLQDALSFINSTDKEQAYAQVENEILKNLWLRATNSKELNPDISFNSHGGDSLECVFLLMEINENFEIDLSIDELYAHDTFNKLNGLIQNKRRKTEQVFVSDNNRMDAFLRDIELSYDDVPFQKKAHRILESNRQKILLTGATGFVGIHILKELLQHDTTSEILCLIRANSAKHAKVRLLEISEKYKVRFTSEEMQRVICQPGDLGNPKLGFTSEKWYQLGNEITKIIHCGAKVNFFDSYENLKKANVESTRELLKFTVEGLPKHFVYVSTVGVFHSEANTHLNRFEESFATGSPDVLPTGYQQSKWVSEKLISRAMERGISAQIIRLGVITGNPETEALNLSDFFVHFLATVYKMGAMPIMRDVDFTPVNFAAKAISQISHKIDTSGMIYHMVSPNPVPATTLASWAQLGGDKLELLPYETWKRQLDDYFEKHPEDSLVKYSPLFKSKVGQSSFVEILLNAPTVETTRTDDILDKVGLTFPDISQALLLQYQATYKRHQLIAPDSSKEIKNENNLFWIVEEMEGFIQQQPTKVLNDNDYFDAFERGKAEGNSFRIDFKGHVKSLGDLFSTKKVHLNGSIHCPTIDPHPLKVQEGLMTISPFEGYSPGRKDSLIFLTYCVHCISRNGKEYVLNGFKVSSNVPDMFYELTQVLFTIKEKDNPTSQWVGMIQIPFQQLFRDQINLMTFRKGLTDKEKQKCRSAWMGILMMNSMKNYMNLLLRDNQVTWEDLHAFAKGVPQIESLVDRYLKRISTFKKFGFLSKMIDFQTKKWFKIK